MIINFDNPVSNNYKQSMPAEAFRYKLATALLPKEKWQSDRQAKVCSDCEKGFMILIRRKHHCRRCGQIFCDKCSENFLDGVFFGPNEKYVRFCIKCYQQLTKYLRQQGVELNMPQSQNVLTVNIENEEVQSETQKEERRSTISGQARPAIEQRKLTLQQPPQLQRRLSTEQIAIIAGTDENATEQVQQEPEHSQDRELHPDYDEAANIKSVFLEDELLINEDSKAYADGLRKKSKEMVYKLCEFLGKSYHFNQEWWECMTQFINQAVEDINIDTLTTNEPTDINYYVKIKKILFLDHTATEYIRGVVFRKNVLHKKMNDYFQNARVMILKGSLEITDQGGQIKSFEEVINIERKTIKKIVERIQKYKPNVLFVEKQVNRIATEQLLQQHITVVQNIQPHILRKIAKSTKSKYLTLDQLEKYNPEKVLGRAREVSFRNYEPEAILRNKTLFDSLKDANNNQELLLQNIRENQQRDGTLMFIETATGTSGVTITLSGPSMSILQCLKKSMMGILRLARHFHLEREMIMLELKMKRKLIQNPLMQIINHCTGDFTKFIYERMSIEDIVKKDSITYTKITYVQADLGNFNDIRENHQALEQYFKENQKLEVKNSKVDFFAEQCPIQNPTKKKIEFYSKDDQTLGAYLILKVTNMEKQSRCNCKRMRHLHVPIYYGPGVYVRIVVESNVFLNEQDEQKLTEEQNNIDLLTERDLITILTSKHQEKKVMIETYVECNLCGDKLTDTVRLKRSNYEYSFIRFLQNMFLSGMGMKESSYEKKIPCEHQRSSRVFSYEKSQVKFFLNTFKQYEVSLMTLNDDKIIEKVKESDLTTIDTRKHELIDRMETTLGIFRQILTEGEIKQTALFKAELEQLFSQIKSFISNECKRINEFKYRNSFDIESDYNQVGQLFMILLDKINETKRKKEVGQDLRMILKRQTIDKFIIANDSSAQYSRTTRDLDIAEDNIGEQIIINEGSYRDRQIEQTYWDNNSDTRSNNNHRESSLPNNSRHNEEDYIQENTSPFVEAILQKQPHTLPMPGQEYYHNNLILQQHESSIKQAQNTIEQFLKPSPNTENKMQSLWNLPQFSWEQEKTEKAFQKYDYIPIYDKDDFSYISFALNHSKYIQDIYIKEGFQQFEDQKFPDTTNESQVQFMKNKLSSSIEKEKEKDLHFSLKLYYEKNSRKHDQSPNLGASISQSMNQSITQSFVQNTSPQLQSQPRPIEQFVPTIIETYSGEHFRPSAILDPKLPLTNSTVKKSKYAEVIIYFPTHFEALRMATGIPLTQFIKSVFGSQIENAEGGKSASCFFKTRDDLFVIKKLSEAKEFLMFREFALEYFKHMWRLMYEKRPSLLCKILGMFEVRTKNNTGYYLVMENLRLGMGPRENLQEYDLKGSQTNRWEQRKGKKVLLDTNFKIDRNGEPIPVVSENYRYIDRAFQNDSKFLHKQKVIDYSLLLLIDKKKQKIRLGIIDYLQFYTWDKSTEHYIKLVIKQGMVPTIVNPLDYKKRFVSEMQKYFIEVSPEI